MSTASPVAPAAARADDGFQRLLHPHLAALHAIARGIVASDDLAHDAVQETLLTLWSQRDAPDDLRGWLVRTVVHKSLHVLRGERRRGAHEERAARERLLACPWCSPPETLEEAELLARLDAALLDLSDDLRTTFLLRAEHGLDYRTIAASLQVPLGTVRSRLVRARAALAARLEPALS